MHSFQQLTHLSLLFGGVCCTYHKLTNLSKYPQLFRSKVLPRPFRASASCWAAFMDSWWLCINSASSMSPQDGQLGSCIGRECTIPNKKNKENYIKQYDMNSFKSHGVIYWILGSESFLAPGPQPMRCNPSSSTRNRRGNVQSNSKGWSSCQMHACWLLLLPMTTFKQCIGSKWVTCCLRPTCS